MAKSLNNQRYIYSVDSNAFARNGWNITIKDIDKARKNRDIVSVGDSQALRMIRDITNNKTTEENINSIKSAIKNKKREKTSQETTKTLKILKNKLNNMLMEENLVSITFKTKKHFKYACKNGVKINKRIYKRIVGTSGGVKKNKVYFCNSEIHSELYNKIRNEYNLDISIVPAKLEAYIALAFSGSSEVEQTRNVLVVKDVVTKFKTKVTLISNDEPCVNNPKMETIEDYEVKNNMSDGCGLVTPEFMEKIKDSLNLDYLPSGINTRWAFCKGMVSTFDFKKYANEVFGETIVKDVWGNKHDINDIDIILTESMLKLHAAYSSIDDYLDKCERNGFKLSVAKVTPKELENERRTNYQYIQALDLDDAKIEKLIRPSISEIKDVLGMDYRKTLIFSKGKELNDENVWLKADDDMHIKALMINPNVINDTYVFNKVRRSISNKINELKIAKIPVKANYQIIIGDPVLLMESMFNKNLEGLLKEKQFYSKYWIDNGASIVAGFRSPMTVKESIVKMNIYSDSKCDEWYKYINTMIIFNGLDNTASALNGADYDSDTVYTTNNEIILSSVFDLPTIVCTSVPSPKVENVLEYQLINSNLNGFGNAVGSITNIATSMYDVMSTFDKSSVEYKELDFRLKTMQKFQQDEIDRIKGIVAKPPLKEWYDIKSNYINIDKNTGEILDNEETVKTKEFNSRICASKKPYFFIYIYKNSMKEYKKFIEATNSNCRYRFRCSVDELKAKDYKTKEEIDFLNQYKKLQPFSTGNCIVNKIAWKVEDEFEDMYNRKDTKYDKYEFYTDKSYNFEITPAIKRKIVNVYKEYLADCKRVVSIDNKEDSITSRDNKFEVYLNKLQAIISNEIELTNILIDMAYNSKLIARNFVWKMSGNQIIKNMLKNNDYLINYPIKDDKGDIIYSGDKFTMKELKIEVV